MKVVVADSFYDSLDYIFSRRKAIKDWFRSIKNWIMRPYTTIKPRYLGHGWCDHVELLPHLMFESLSIFIEKECSPGCVEWHGDWAHKVVVDGQQKCVRDEMQELYDWWHNTYIPFTRGESSKEKEIQQKINELSTDLDSDLNAFFKALNTPKEKRDDKHTQYFELLAALNNYEAYMNKELDERLHRLINIRHSMWT